MFVSHQLKSPIQHKHKLPTSESTNELLGLTKTMSTASIASTVALTATPDPMSISRENSAIMFNQDEDIADIIGLFRQGSISLQYLIDTTKTDILDAIINTLTPSTEETEALLQLGINFPETHFFKESVKHYFRENPNQTTLLIENKDKTQKMTFRIDENRESIYRMINSGRKLNQRDYIAIKEKISKKILERNHTAPFGKKHFYIGKGGMAKVKLVSCFHSPDDSKIGKLYVVKRFSLKTQYEHQINRILEPETRYTGTHANIIKPEGTFKDIKNDTLKLYIVFPLADDDLITNYHPINNKDPYNIARQIILGVQELHKNKIYHGDLKPDNLFIFEENHQLTIKIGDLGMSSRDLTTTKKQGTEAYWAPEFISKIQLKSRKIVPKITTIINNKAADKWAVGLIIRGLGQGSEFDTYSYYSHKNPTDETGLTPLEKIGNMLLKKNPLERASLDDVITELNNYTHAVDEGDIPPPPPYYDSDDD